MEGDVQFCLDSICFGFPLQWLISFLQWMISSELALPVALYSNSTGFSWHSRYILLLALSLELVEHVR